MKAMSLDICLCSKGILLQLLHCWCLPSSFFLLGMCSGGILNIPKLYWFLYHRMLCVFQFNWLIWFQFLGVCCTLNKMRIFGRIWQRTKTGIYQSNKVAFFQLYTWTTVSYHEAFPSKLLLSFAFLCFFLLQFFI